MEPEREVLRDGTRGKNARGVCLHKPDKRRTKRPKRQRLPIPPAVFDDLDEVTGMMPTMFGMREI